MAQGMLYHEINAFIEYKKDDKILTLSNHSVYTDRELNLCDIDCDFIPYKGDRIKMYIIKDDPPKVYKIEPWDELRVQTGKINLLTKSFGVVDDEIIFFPDQENFIKWDAKVDDDVTCVVIEGEYDVGKTKYEYRCENIKKFETIEQTQNAVELYFNDETTTADTNGVAVVSVENVDSDTENVEDEEPKMEFSSQKKREPNQEFYDLPYGLFDIIMSKKVHIIKRRLDQIVPKTLNYNTYRTRFHALIFLEEIEMKASFDRYKSDQVRMIDKLKIK